MAHSRSLAVFAVSLLAGCGGTEGDGGPDSTGTPDAGNEDAAWGNQDGGTDASVDAVPPTPPTPRDPCTTDACWSAPALGGVCGASISDEDFSTGNYNVHDYALTVPAGVTADLELAVTGGSWNPALIVLASDGTTLYDGEIGVAGDDPTVTPMSSGKGDTTARVLVTPKADLSANVFATGWSVVDGGFTSSLPTDATYTLSALLDCAPPTPGTLLSPPNFDPNEVQNGFYQLPPSEPPGLYTLKGAACSWGTKLLIDVIYTVATQWKPLYPAYSPLSIRDMNENTAACGTNHQTHDDGTHVDIVAGCATQVSCTNDEPAIALAKLFVDTGVACGILNNDTGVQAVVNAYFASKWTYAPWNGQFMRSVSGHDSHFHVRVKKPDGSCN